jgi:predicted RNA-binding protein
MKTKQLLMLTMAIFSLCITSCSKDDIDETNNNNDTEQKQQEPTYLQASDLQGVWSVSGSFGLYFISFTETGHYSLCFNSKLMGAGTFSLAKNTLTLNNGYLYTKDVLTIEKKEDKLILSGDMFDFKSSSKQPVNVTLVKKTKEIPIPKTGETFKIWGLHATYGSIVTKIQYQSEYLIKYQYCKDNSLQQVIEEAMWYYVYCDGMTYTQNCSGNGNVVIYKLQDHYSTLKSQIVQQ